MTRMRSSAFLAIISFIILSCISPTYAQLSCSGGALNCNPGQLPGTSTNDSANAGNVGEYISSSIASGSAVTLASGSASPITSIVLTAGDWEVTGAAIYVEASTTSVTSFVQGSTSAANCLTSPVIPPDNQYTSFEIDASILAPVVNPAWNIPTTRYSVAVPTTVCLMVKPTFTASTLKGYGLIQARRMR